MIFEHPAFCTFPGWPESALANCPTDLRARSALGHLASPLLGHMGELHVHILDAQISFLLLKIERKCSFTNEIKKIKEVFSLNIFRVISPSSGAYRLKQIYDRYMIITRNILSEKTSLMFWISFVKLHPPFYF